MSIKNSEKFLNLLKNNKKSNFKLIKNKKFINLKRSMLLRKATILGILSINILSFSYKNISRAVNDSESSYTQAENDFESESLDFLDFFEKNRNLPVINENCPYNEIDALVFSTIAYLPMAFTPSYGESFQSNYNIKNLADSIFDFLNLNNNIINNTAEEHVLNYYKNPDNREKNILRLLELISENPRYKDIKIGDAFCRCEKRLEVGSVEQFAGITFTLLDNTKIVTMRGTDNTLAGWKEDFDLGWSDNVQSEMHAQAYLGGIAHDYPSSKIAVTGHSKGGHLAVYSSLIFSSRNPENLKRILNIYNFDGPGLRKDIIAENQASFNKIKNKIITYIPQTSIVGKILSNNNKNGNIYKYIQSKGKFISQHDNFNWQVNPSCMESKREKFILPEDNKTDLTSEVFEKTFRKLIKSLSKKEKEIFSRAVFKVFGYEDPDVIFLNITDSKFKILTNIWKLSREELNSFSNFIDKSINSFSQVSDKILINENALSFFGNIKTFFIKSIFKTTRLFFKLLASL